MGIVFCSIFIVLLLLLVVIVFLLQGFIIIINTVLIDDDDAVAIRLFRLWLFARRDATRGMFATGALELAQELIAKRASGKLVNGIHDPFGMLPSTVAGRVVDTAAPEGDEDRAARGKVADVPALALKQAPALHLKPTPDTARIQELRLMTAIKTPCVAALHCGAAECACVRWVVGSSSGSGVGGGGGGGGGGVGGTTE